jgi:DNA-binding transcriptional MerR regulator
MSEVKRMLDLPSSTLRYWEEQFSQLSPRKDEHGNRYYTEKDIDFIKQVKYLRNELHITRIAAIKNELRSNAKQVDVRQKASDILLQIRSELIEIKAKI